MMASKLLALAALTTLCTGAVAQDAGEDEALTRALKPTELTRFAASGERTRIVFGYSLNPSCASAGKIVVKVLKKPQHGEITVRTEDGFANFAADNVRAKCNSVPAPVTAVYYTSEPDFVGEDSAQVLVLYAGSGAANLDNVSVLVR